jgi:hypothetical protein
MAFALLMSVESRGGEAPLPDLTKGTSGIDRSLTYTSSYNGVSPNACYVLSYATPMKTLCITGKDMPSK